MPTNPRIAGRHAVERAALHHLADLLHYLVPERVHPDQALHLAVAVESPELVRQAADRACVPVETHTEHGVVYTRAVVPFGAGTDPTGIEHVASAARLEVLHIGLVPLTGPQPSRDWLDALDTPMMTLPTQRDGGEQ